MASAAPRSLEERSQIWREMDARVAALPETNVKGKLRGVLIRLHEALDDPTAFEAEFKKLAALSEKVARETPAARLRAAVEEHLAQQ